MRIWHSNYTEIITLENLFQAWEEFIKGKKSKADVQLFGRNLEDNIFSLYKELEGKTYRHGSYQEFYVRDPKVRHIHKACVKDRVVHHLTSKMLEELFDPTFYPHSYSCRKGKGTHKAVQAFIKMSRKASKNNTSKLLVLKCDIKKFFANVDHQILIKLLRTKIKDDDFVNLLTEIITSFKSPNQNSGMPIGNLTSQLFANIYMDPLDQFVKHKLKVKHYIRYADDFAVLSDNREYLEKILSELESFLATELKLSLHPNKIHIVDYYLGVDFLGYVIFPKYILPRTKTKKRIFRKLAETSQKIKDGILPPEALEQALQSYLGHLSHCNGYKLSQEIKNHAHYFQTN